MDSTKSATYAYDVWARLKTANTGQWGLSFTYDRFGNRTQQNVTAGSGVPSNSLTISPTTNRVTGASYDSAGNMTNDGSNTLAYDAENHVVSATNGSASGTYTLDGGGLRVKKVSGSTTTVYIFSGSKVIAEYDNGAAVTSPSREYIYAGSQLVAKVEAGATNYFHPDHLSTRVNTDSSGNVSRTFGQYPFGEVWYETGTANKLKFTTYERGSESGNDYALARSYINRYGRFSSPDPLSGSLSEPQSLNRYAYVLNDPINFYDPSGFGPCGGGTAVSSTIGGIQYPGTATSDPPCYFGNVEQKIHCTFGVTNGPNTICNDPNSGRGGFVDRLLNDIKDLTHTVVCTVTAPLVQVAQTNGGVVGAGVGGSAGVGLVWGLALQGSVQVVADPQGNVGVAFSGGGNPGFGVFGAGAVGGIQYSISSAHTISDLRGQSHGGGVSGAIGYAGVGLDIAGSKSADTLTLTVGPGYGGKGAAYAITGTAVPNLLSTNCGVK